MRTAALLLALCAAASSTGCYRYVTRLPGVVDLRTDGSEAERAAAVPVAPTARRDGLVALALGAGAQQEAGHVTVEERHYWFLGAIPILNTSAREEVSAAVAASGALRRVSIGEQMSVIDVLVTLVGRFVPLAQYVLPSYTFSFAGDAVVAPPSDRRRPGSAPHDDGAPIPRAATPLDDDPALPEALPGTAPLPPQEPAPPDIAEPPPLLEPLPAPAAEAP